MIQEYGVNMRLLIASIFLLVFSQAYATLIDRGNGLIYNDVLDITWLQDANYALTTLEPTANALGGLEWDEAITWVTNLTYFDPIRNVTHTGWRLPTVSAIDGSSILDTSFSNNASTDEGYATFNGWRDGTGQPVSELGHLGPS